MRKTILSLAVAASALTAAAANAQGTPAVAPSETRAQAIAQADVRFAQIDTNHDGLISTTEMQEYRAAIHDRMIARGGDAPPSGGGNRDDRRHAKASMSKAQFETRAGERFDRVDANHDGVIDATERANRAEMRHVERREHREGTTSVSATPAPAQ